MYRAPIEHDQGPLKFTVNTKDKDVIWIPKNLKTVSTWIDSLINKRVNYFNTLKSFFNMIQGPL